MGMTAREMMKKMAENMRRLDSENKGTGGKIKKMEEKRRKLHQKRIKYNFLSYKLKIKI